MKNKKYPSAKVVIFGKSKVGKTCLAARLAEKRFLDPEEIESTVGLKIWNVPVNHNFKKRNICIWDFGGKEEYQIVHNLLLEDTALALVLTNSNYVDVSLDELKGWQEYIDKHFNESNLSKIVNDNIIKKFLVFTQKDDKDEDWKMDIDETKLKEIENLRYYVEKHSPKDGENKYYFETSARRVKDPKKIEHLLNNIKISTNIDKQPEISNLELYELIENRINKYSKKGKIVFEFKNLIDTFYQEFKIKYQKPEIENILIQMSKHGIIAITRPKDVEEKLAILDVEKFDTSACALIDIIIDKTKKKEIQAISKDELDQYFINKSIQNGIIKVFTNHCICFDMGDQLVFPSLNSLSIKPPKEIGSPFICFPIIGPVDNIYARLLTHLIYSKSLIQSYCFHGNHIVSFQYKGKSKFFLKLAKQNNGYANLFVSNDENISQVEQDEFKIIIERNVKNNQALTWAGDDIICKKCLCTIKNKIRDNECDVDVCKNLLDFAKIKLEESKKGNAKKEAFVRIVDKNIEGKIKETEKKYAYAAEPEEKHEDKESSQKSDV